MRFEPLLLMTALLLSACDGRGVDLGSEELCVQDPRLAQAQAESPMAERVSLCASIGNNLLGNSDFETPEVAGCDTGAFCQFPANQVPSWLSDSEQGIIELWSDGNQNVQAAEGAQFAELDAESQDTLWQDLEVPGGQWLYWSVQHRGRFGIDTFEMRLGPPEAPQSRGTFSSAEDAWSAYAGLYQVPEGQTVTRFALVSRSRSGSNSGNLVDAAFLAPVN